MILFLHQNKRELASRKLKCYVELRLLGLKLHYHMGESKNLK